jgi:AcrR family transcriptional regulator
MATRGSYAKGVAKREEILSAALEVVAERGYRGSSVRELAAAVGLSQAGLLHYFASKEELYVEILRKRDEVDRSRPRFEAGNVVESLAAIVAHNVTVPGLVELYAQMSVEAADPEHPAHAFFTRRNTLLRNEIAAQLEQLRAAGRMRDDVEPKQAATMLIALADGLQTQWLVDPGIDMVAQIRAFWQLLSSG